MTSAKYRSGSGLSVVGCHRQVKLHGDELRAKAEGLLEGYLGLLVRYLGLLLVV